MLTLLMCVTGGDSWINPYKLLATRGWLLSGLFLFFLLFFFIAAWNIITSRFVEAALKLAAPDTDDLAFEQRMKDVVDAAELKELFLEVDADFSQSISLEEFRLLMRHPKLKSYLQVRGIDIKNAEIFFMMLRSLAGEDSDVGI